MARDRGILGFEAGDFSTIGGTGVTTADLVLSSASARSGNYRFNSKLTVGAAAKAITWQQSIATIGSGVSFDFRFRFYFRPVTLPSATALVIGGFIGGGGSAPQHQLEMDTTGRIRMVSNYQTAPAFTGSALTLGAWYRADVRTHGFGSTLTKTNSARVRQTIDVYDDSNNLIVSFETTYTGTVSIDHVPGSGTPGFAETQSAGGTAWLTVAGKVSGYFQTVTSGAYSGQSFATVVNEFEVTSGSTFGSSVFSANMQEHGTLQGVDLVHFIEVNSVTTVPSLQVGQTVGNVSTREIDYDDIVWDLRTDTDVASTDDYPAGTHINVFAVTGQGSFNQFAPAGGWARVNEIPMDGVATVSSNVLGDTSTYTHPNAAVAFDKCYHIRIYANAQGAASHKILIGTEEFSCVFSAATGSADTSTNKADKSYGSSPLTDTAFNAQEFGVKIGTAADTLSLKNILMEALIGPGAAPIEEDVVDAFATGTLGFSLGNQGVEVNAPATWRLERFDIGPRVEERS